jgi:cell division protein FtsI (penicillin-binding protein 3)
MLSAFGVGRLTGSGFPAESAGYLNDPTHWGEIGQATLSYGYGLAVTCLQLARAYTAIAAEGLLPPVSFLALDDLPARERVLEAATATELMQMLELVVSPAGTGNKAAVQNYRIAGKTGTARISEAGRYSDDRYTAVFAGIAPASRPRIVTVVVINDPRGQAYYGGDVAAPVFAKVVTGALRILALPPDKLAEAQPTLMSQAQVHP